MAEMGNHAGKEPWPSLEWATWIFDRASFVLIGSLVIGAGATVAMVWMGIAKEHHWDLLREGAAKEIEGTKLEAATANKEAAIARLAAERLRLRFVWRMIDSEPRKRISEKMRVFAPQKFSVLTYRNDDPEASNFGANIRSSLEDAGWQFVDVGPLPWLTTGLWLAWVNGSGAKLGPVAQVLGNALTDEGVQPNGYESSERYQEHPEVLFVIVGKKPPSGLEIPSLDNRDK